MCTIKSARCDLHDAKVDGGVRCTLTRDSSENEESLIKAEIAAGSQLNTRAAS
jgi:hypothetical protein